MLVKNEILYILKDNIVSFRAADGSWFEGIDSENFDSLTNKLAELFNKQVSDLTKSQDCNNIGE